MYTHSDTRQNYAHHGQPLAHPYGSNFNEVLSSGEWRKGRWYARELFSWALMGQDTGEWSWGNNIFRPESDRPPRDDEGRRQNEGYYVGGVVPQQVVFSELRGGWTIDPGTGLALEAAWQWWNTVPEGGATRTTHYFRLGIVCRFREDHPAQQVRYVLP
jgi:hypothetical protein